ncbi:MAG: hypothetical protein EB084_17115 [Proteobacteria bacterium]|nr:hypothetical protein [Pseudomonadota bacterium]
MLHLSLLRTAGQRVDAGLIAGSAPRAATAFSKGHLTLSVLRALAGLFGRGNPSRAFGHGVYLSPAWSDGASRHQYAPFFAQMRRLSAYKLLFDCGEAADDGAVRFSRAGEDFVTEAERWGREQKHPFACTAWVRLTSPDGQCRVLSRAFVRNLTYSLRFFQMFSAVMIDPGVEPPEEDGALLELVRAVRRECPAQALGVRLRVPWLDRRALVRGLTETCADVEVSLQGASQSSVKYAQWCERSTKAAMELVGAKALLLGLPATSLDNGPPESLESALRGVRRGMEAYAPERVRVLLYREGLASDADWKIFARDWLS